MLKKNFKCIKQPLIICSLQEYGQRNEQNVNFLLLVWGSHQWCPVAVSAQKHMGSWEFNLSWPLTRKFLLTVLSLQAQNDLFANKHISGDLEVTAGDIWPGCVVRSEAGPRKQYFSGPAVMVVKDKLPMTELTSYTVPIF